MSGSGTELRVTSTIYPVSRIITEAIGVKVFHFCAKLGWEFACIKNRGACYTRVTFFDVIPGCLRLLPNGVTIPMPVTTTRRVMRS